MSSPSRHALAAFSLSAMLTALARQAEERCDLSRRQGGEPASLPAPDRTRPPEMTGEVERALAMILGLELRGEL